MSNPEKTQRIEPNIGRIESTEMDYAKAMRLAELAMEGRREKGAVDLRALNEGEFDILANYDKTTKSIKHVPRRLLAFDGEGGRPRFQLWEPQDPQPQLEQEISRQAPVKSEAIEVSKDAPVPLWSQSSPYEQLTQEEYLEGAAAAYEVVNDRANDDSLDLTATPVADVIPASAQGAKPVTEAVYQEPVLQPAISFGGWSKAEADRNISLFPDAPTRQRPTGARQQSSLVEEPDVPDIDVLS
jgi:hypothetical protein